MNNPLSVERDERILAVENASYRWAYLFLSFGLLLDVLYRSTVLEQNSWDLMALVVLGGLAATVYQGAHRVLTRRWARLAIIIMLIAAAVAATIVLVR
jgi:hypothetical protein